MKRIVIIICILVLISSCNNNKIEQPILDVENPTTTTDENLNKEDTVKLSYYIQCSDRTKKFYEDIVKELNILSQKVPGVFLDVDFIFPSKGENTKDYLEECYNAGMLPDIMFATEMYPGVTSNVRQRNDLHNFVNKNYAADITEYINDKTPYISSFYKAYPNFRELSSFGGRIYGVILYDNITEFLPRMIIKKSICDTLNIDSVTDFAQAFEWCLRIKESGLSDKIFINGRLIMNSIVDEAGYYNLFADIPYIYLLKHNDENCQVVRIEETDIFEKMITIKQQLEYSNIYTTSETLREYKDNPDEWDVAIVRTYNNINISDYKTFYLSDEPFHIINMQYQLPYLMISETCQNKQIALKYLDWLHTNTDARKLAAFGIEDVNYNYDKNNRYIYWDDDVTFTNLMYLGGGDQIETIEDRIYGGLNNKVYLRTNLLKNFTMNSLAEKLLSHPENITYYYEEVFWGLRQKYNKQYKIENTELLGRRNRLDFTFYQDVSIEKLKTYDNLFKESRNRDFIDEIQRILDSLQ